MKPKAKKSVFKFAAVKIWIIVTSALMTFLITTTCVLTLNSFLYNTINMVLGGERMALKKGTQADVEAYTRFRTQYKSKSEVLTAAEALNEQICEEGFILLKNEDDALPLEPGSRITVFGKNSVNLVLGGSGSSAGSASGASDGLYQSLADAGFIVNPVLKRYYTSSQSGGGRPATPGMGQILTGFPTGEAPVSANGYSTEVIASYQNYSDAALVVISRMGGEGYDMPRSMFWDEKRYTNWSGDTIIPGARSKDDHYLQLDQNETAMLAEACSNFDKVVLILNSSTPIELGFLDDETHYAYQPNLKAALWIGFPGRNGIKALGRVLSGEVNPSGRTVDTFARNFKLDPTWNNFGNNLSENGNRYTLNGSPRNAFFVDYEEGIYIGYRYYETRGFTEGDTEWTDPQGNTYPSWYEGNVVYPFGYGLSYTTFTQSISQEGTTASGAVGKDDTITVKITVKNTGSKAGKEVVQLYYTAPYYDGQIEKAHVVLGDFAKTKLLEPDEEQTLTLNIKVRDMASYDYNDANGNGFRGYELDPGVYTVKLMRNAHETIDSIDYTVTQNIQYTNDPVTGAQITNLFDDVSEHIKTYLSRSNWEGTFPTRPTDEDRAVTQEFINSLTYKLNDKPDDPWYTENMPQQSEKVLSYKETKIKLYDMFGLDYDDPKWDELLDQLTIEQMRTLVIEGCYHTEPIQNIAKPYTIDADGPVGFAAFMGNPEVYSVCYYASPCVTAATWNIDLALKYGEMIGDEGLIGNEKGDGKPYTGWYAPAINIHRSPFSGRNYEYYSEDGLLSGKMAAQVIRGARSRGLITYVKHFALNDQETNRDTTGLITWANEQSMRELYFIPFELAVKEGQANGMMSAFNRIGAVWAGGSYPLLTKLLRHEWGFVGAVITDFNLKPYMDIDQMVRAGGDISLSANKSMSSSRSATTTAALRNATKNILFVYANSNAMNGFGPNVIWGLALPYWVIGLISATCATAVICGIWGALVIISAKKKVIQA